MNVTIEDSFQICRQGNTNSILTFLILKVPKNFARQNKEIVMRGKSYKIIEVEDMEKDFDGYSLISVLVKGEL